MHGVGPALVVAGPGSGKTFTITHRILYLIENLSISPDKILVITFTKAAALQMKERTDKMSFHKYSMINFGTFHALFFKILIREGIYTPDSIIKDSEKLKIVGFLSQKYNLQNDSANQLYAHIINDISRYKSFIFSLKNSNTEEFHPFSTNLDTFIQIYKDYSKELEFNNKLDFDDMQLKAYDLLANNEKIREKYKSQYEYIMIDEFQDINPLQMEIVSLLLNDKKNLFVVGDDDQSIYSFRGSKPDIMLGFFEKFPSAKKIVLEYNYRCAANIIEASSLVIAKNENRFIKMVKPDRNDEGVVEVFECLDRLEEVTTFIDFINLHSNELNDIAIITRTNKISAYYAQELANRNIEFRLKEKVNDIYSTLVGKDIVAYLKLINGDMSRGNFLYICNKPERNIYREALDVVIDFKRLADYQKNVYGNSNDIERLCKDVRLLKSMSAFAVVHYVLYKMGYIDFLKKYARSHQLDYESLYDNAAEILEHAKGYKTVKSFLKSIEDYQEEIANNNANLKAQGVNDGKNAVNIMTMHASKGLEFKYVFLPDVIEGIVPYQKALSIEQIEEERRLFYVAMTRAKDELHILYPKCYLDKAAIKSRFVDELELLSENKP